jgi:lysophospholipid acyltransferase (LPLAT)-like uncharacterized protein
MCRHLRLGVVRGSTTRGGVRAVREILDLDGRYNIVVTPDGPRGPRRQVERGLPFLASRTKMAVVPAGFAYHRCWRLPSWDRFAVPYPGSPAVGVIGAPIEVPPDAGRSELERYRLAIESALLEVTEQAEGWAARERW